MAFRITPKIMLPIGNLKKISDNFLDRNFYDQKLWGTHLGVDIDAQADTKVFSIGRGVIVYSKLHPGEFSGDGKIIRRNWGGILIIAHKNPKNKKVFYSLYGHLGKRYFKKGDPVEMGELIGTVGKSMSESNGIWENEHLHFAIYEGPYHEKVLPGYYKESIDTAKLEYWQNPIKYIRNYSRNFS